MTSEEVIHCFLDTETTGLDHRQERIRQIGAVKGSVRQGVIAELTIYVDTEGQVSSPDAQMVHGIAARRDDDVPEKDVPDLIEDFIQDHPVVIHNAEFDMAFLKDLYGRVGRPLFANQVIDSVALARARTGLQKVSLDALAQHYSHDQGVRDTNARRTRHDATLDCRLLFHVWRQMTAPLELDLAARTEAALRRAELRPEDLRDPAFARTFQ